MRTPEKLFEWQVGGWTLCLNPLSRHLDDGHVVEGDLFTGLTGGLKCPISRETPLASQHLTKSRYIAGLQCLRRLWLVVHEPMPYEEPAPGSPLDMGYVIGTKARLLFPDGVLVTEEPWQHAEAVAHTQALMNDEQLPAIFEAAFEFDGIRIRVDVIERLVSGAWGLREVKSSASLKDHYLDDIALQAYVLRGAGIEVSSIGLLHVNTAYVRGPGSVCWKDFFARIDVGEAVAERLVDLPNHLPAMRDCLAVDFRALDPVRFQSAVREHRCWVCGDRLGKHIAFVGGPLSAAQRLYTDPPAHVDCAEFSAKVCPFLAIPTAHTGERRTNRRTSRDHGSRGYGHGEPRGNWRAHPNRLLKAAAGRSLSE